MTMLADRDPRTFSPIEALLLAELDPELHEEAVAAFLSTFSAQERSDVLPFAWQGLWARPSQLPPPDTEFWRTWFVRAGRGYGKTRIGSETVRKRVDKGQARAVLLIGKSASDARDVMIEGPDSGLLAVHPKDTRPTYEASKRLLTWPNGAIGHVRTGADPESIRGLQSDLVWGDEPASWAYGEEAWDNAMFGLRLGTPKSILTGTPKRRKWLRKIERANGTVLTTGSMYENKANLAVEFVELVLDRYEGTRLGLQEIYGRELDDVEGALWSMEWIPFKPLPEAWSKIVVGFDPAVTSGDKSDEHGIVVVGKAADGDVFVIDDLTCQATPVGAMQVALAAARKYHATVIVLEDNQGKETWQSVWKQAGGDDADCRLQYESASRSKETRAIPAATAYERATMPNPPFRVWHNAEQVDGSLKRKADAKTRKLELLEEQMVSWVFGDEKKGDGSPDRIDALVWAFHGLGIKAGGTGTKRAGSLSAL